MRMTAMIGTTLIAAPIASGSTFPIALPTALREFGSASVGGGSGRLFAGDHRGGLAFEVDSAMPVASSHGDHGCCSPSRGTATRRDTPTASVTPARLGSTAGMVELPGGVYVIGSDDPWAYPDDGETPRVVEVSAFR